MAFQHISVDAKAVQRFRNSITGMLADEKKRTDAPLVQGSNGRTVIERQDTASGHDLHRSQRQFRKLNDRIGTVNRWLPIILKSVLAEL